jgi:hypothetical protein
MNREWIRKIGEKGKVKKKAAIRCLLKLHETEMRRMREKEEVRREAEK